MTMNIYDLNSAAPQSETAERHEAQPKSNMPTNNKPIRIPEPWEFTLNDENLFAAIYRVTDLAAVMNFPLPELVKWVVGSYETSLNDVRSGHEEAYGWPYFTDEEREAVEEMNLPITEECLACGVNHETGEAQDDEGDSG